VLRNGEEEPIISMEGHLRLLGTTRICHRKRC